MTDVCSLIIGVLFGLILFIVCCCVYNNNNLLRINYPANSSGNVCMLDTQTSVHNYPFLYFNNITNPAVGR